MWKKNFREAATEVLDILNHTIQSDVSKIPNNFINLLKENADYSYIPNLDHSLSLDKMSLKIETKQILGTIYRKWWASSDESEELYKTIKQNKLQKEQELQEKYDVDKIFKKRHLITNENNNINANSNFNSNDTTSNNTYKSEETTCKSLQVQNKSFIYNIINKIKNFFKGGF